MEPTPEQRLRDANPLRQRTDADETRDQQWLRETSRSVISQDPRPRKPKAIVIGAAAAATVIAAAVGGIALRGTDNTSDDNTNVTAATVTDLALGPETLTMSSCIPFSVDTLAAMPVAFSGQVTERTSDHVLMDVDTWYRGGDTDQVRLLAPDMSRTSLGDIVDFQDGQRYLVTATDGTVNYCGFTAPWSQNMADAFAAAFSAP